jgi:hypothetical protein
MPIYIYIYVLAGPSAPIRTQQRSTTGWANIPIFSRSRKSYSKLFISLLCVRYVSKTIRKYYYGYKILYKKIRSADFGHSLLVYPDSHEPGPGRFISPQKLVGNMVRTISGAKVTKPVCIL